ncbi:MAG TPA: purine-nucleoside phosphorylase [Candidatus Competibacteraceae bacterium]|nr:purine-nucleoside phosphorylase [Candidatus Competibacteraceae bacterium]
MTTDSPFAAAELIRRRAPGFTPRLGLILGSGLGGLADELDEAVAIPYADIPGFPQSSVPGHAGELVLGRLEGVPLACLKGRVHAYEGHGLAVMAVPVRAFRLLGAELLLLTNAAGSLRPEVGAGKVCLISDHINLLPGNPLAGPNDERYGPRFFSMADAYDAGLRARMQAVAQRLGIALAEGVYLATLGPSFETPAEIRAFRTLGADLVGMSTVPEVLLARHCGLKVLALSAVTNLAEGLSAVPLSHEQTLEYAAVAARDLRALVRGFVAGLD